MIPTPRTYTAAVMKKDKFGNPFKDREATITLDFAHTDGEYTYAMLIPKENHYLGKVEFEPIRAVIEDAFCWILRSLFDTTRGAFARRRIGFQSFMSS